MTVADVDDKVRLQHLDTWFDPLDMFRQIAPHGVVSKESMNRHVDMATAIDVGPDFQPEKAQEAPVEQPAVQLEAPSNDGAKIAKQFNNDKAMATAPEDVLPKHISNSTSEPADAFVPHQGTDQEKPATEPMATDPSPAQAVAEEAATHPTSASIQKPESNFQDAQEHQPSIVAGAATTETTTTDVPRSIYSSAVTGNVENTVKLGQTGEFHDESRYIRDKVDEHLESGAEKVHPHSKAMEEVVQPQAGEAVAASATSEETRVTHEEMSRITPGECPFLMNRE